MSSRQRTRVAFAPILIGTLVAFLGGCNHTQPPAPPNPVQPLEYVGEWLAVGEDSLRLEIPFSFAADSGGFVYIADAGTGKVHKYDAQGHRVLSFTDPRLERPTGVAVGPDGSIYVSAYASDRVIVFSPQGKPLREMRRGLRQRIDGPQGLTLDRDGFLYVVEFEGSRMNRFDAQGRPVQTWGKGGNLPGEFHFPVDAAVGPDGFLYVADTHNRRVEKFTREGEFLLAWGRPGTAPDMMDDIFGIAVTDRHVFLADGGNRRLQVWTLDGQYVLTLPLAEKLSGDIEAPSDVAFGANNELLVLDPSGSRVLRFRARL